MKKLITLLLLLNFSLNAQNIADFENFGIPQDTFLNGSDGSRGFQSGDIFLPNSFQDFGSFTSWSGWSISTMTDIITPGFTNDFSAITGSGTGSSFTYATTFVNGHSTIELTEQSGANIVEGLYVTNSTYAYLSMRDGDSFAKKFGGADGNDPDYFLLTIKKYYDGELSEDSIDFYLADFRFQDNSMDYIIDDWTYIELSSLGFVDSLHFSLSSTDNGAFGMNTPAYFCIDNVSTSIATSTKTPEIDLADINIYPNPASEFINIESKTPISKIEILDNTGNIIRFWDGNHSSLNISDFYQGLYFIRFINESGGKTKTFIKN